MTNGSQLDSRQNTGYHAREIAEDITETGYKDELNLAEFPIAALADRVPHGQLSMVFEDQLEQREGPPIVRRLTITGSPKNGLPTALDDEIMVGLIQLTKRRNNFTDPKVTFSRYELIELLGWPQSGTSYQRIEEALYRWVGVVLMYENAWWDNTAKSWVDETFHILDNVTLYDRERRKLAGRTMASNSKRSPDQRVGNAPLPLSSFRWNEVIFRSFQAGNLKQLDLEFYLGLRLPTTKRMFRFLDKRFYRRERIDFDLKTFAYSHIGLSPSYAPTELKRRLKPALEELEEKGFLEPLLAEERYSYKSKGQWRILFIRGSNDRDIETTEYNTESANLISSLVERGVNNRIAKTLVNRGVHSRIRTKIEVYDWLIQNGDKRISKNGAGFLVTSIRSDYGDPSEYLAKADRVVTERSKTDAEQKRKVEESITKDQVLKDAVLKVKWDALSSSQREAITAKIRMEHPGLKRWKAMIEPLCLAELERVLSLGKPIPSIASQAVLFEEDSGME
jgi:hypothetical protein